MKEESNEAVRGFVAFWCEHCQIKVMRPTYWKRRYCPVCAAEMVVHINRKEVNDAQEEKPAGAG